MMQPAEKETVSELQAEQGFKEGVWEQERIGMKVVPEV